MKPFFTILFFVFLAMTPSFVGAHVGITSFGDAETGYGMMRYVEDRALGDDALHEEMEELMIKMMAGTLTEEEANRLAELADQYPGPHGMMMNRLMWGTNQNYGGGWHMPFWGTGMTGGGGWWSFFMVVSSLIWLGIGILVLAWLWKHVMKK